MKRARVYIVVALLILPFVLTPVASAGEPAVTGPGYIQQGIGGLCNGLDWLTNEMFGCDRAVPVLGTAAAIGTCVAVGAATVGIGLAPCAVGAASFVGIGAVFSSVTDQGCQRGASELFAEGPGVLYDDCLTAGWGATKVAVENARHGEASAWDATTAGIDFVSAAIPITGVGTVLGLTKPVAGAAPAAAKGFWASTKTLIKGGDAVAGQQLVKAGTTMIHTPAITRAAQNAFKPMSFWGTTGSKVAGAPKVTAGVMTKLTGKGLEKGWVRLTVKTGVPATSGAFFNPVVNIAKSPIDAPPTGTGPGAGSVVPPSTRQDGLTISFQSPVNATVYDFNESVDLAFTIAGDKLSSWSVWVALEGGSPVKLGGASYTVPKTGTQSFSEASTFPPGEYIVTAMARYSTAAEARESVTFSVEDASGSVPPPEKWPSACQLDLNKDGQKDCVERFAGHFDRRVGEKPNSVAVFAGLFVLVGIIGFVAYAAYRRE